MPDMTSFDELEVSGLSHDRYIEITKNTVCIAKNLAGIQKIVVFPTISFCLFLFDDFVDQKVESQLIVVHGAGSHSEIVRYSILRENAVLEAQMQLDISLHAEGAQASYLHKVLLLADSARVITKPELVIFHDAVMGKHGATISSVPQSEAEYLMARGISSDTIKTMYAGIFEAQLCDLVLTK